MTLGSVAVAAVGAIVVLLVEARSREARTQERPAPVHQVAHVIALDLPAIQILRQLGSPTCRERVEDGERWIFARIEPAGGACTPAEGDLLVVVQNERIIRFTPEYRRSREVKSGEDLTEFRRWYAAGR